MIASTARRRLSPGETALVVVVAVLVLVFLVLFVQRMASGDGAASGAGATTTAGTTTSAGTTSGPDASADLADVVDLASLGYSFQMPSGNIGCVMSEESVLCAIRTFDYQPPDVAGCAADTGVAVRLDSDGTAHVCSTGTPEFGDAAQLPYGESRTVGEFTCTSSEAGISCSNAAGQEFSLRRADFAL